MWYEIRTGSTETIEEVGMNAKGKGKEKKNDDELMGDAEEMDFGDIGGIEEEEPERVTKLKVNHPLTHIMDVLTIGINRDRSPHRS